VENESIEIVSWPPETALDDAIEEWSPTRKTLIGLLWWRVGLKA